MEWESVKYIDPYLGLYVKDKPYTEVEKELHVHKPVIKEDLPYIPPQAYLFDPNVPVILVFGGIEPNVVRDSFAAGESVFLFNPSQNQWNSFGSMPERRNYHQASFIRGNVYITGGNNPSIELCERFQATNTTFRLHVKSRKWAKMTNMKFHRSFHSATVIDDYIFVFGGRDNLGSFLNTAEKYNPETDEWTVVRQMPEPRMGMACTVCRGLVWLIGGVTGPGNRLNTGFTVLTTVTCYDPVKNQYFDRRSLPEPRAFAQAATIFKEVWLLGGLTRSKLGKLSSVDWINWFNFALNRWDRRHKLTTARHSSSIGKILHKVYLIGGMKDENVMNETEMYDRKEDKLMTLPGMPNAVTGTAACVVPYEYLGFDKKEDQTEGGKKDKDNNAATVVASFYRGHKTRANDNNNNSGKNDRKKKKKRSHTAQMDKSLWKKWERVQIPSWPAPPLPSSSEIVPCERQARYAVPGGLSMIMKQPQTAELKKEWRFHYINFLPENDPNLGTVMFIDSNFNRQKKVLGLRVVDKSPFWVAHLKHTDELMHDSLPVIVALGGFDPHDPLNLNSGRAILRYHPLKNRWEYYGLMPAARSHHAVCYLDGIIYITGGYDPTIRDAGEIIATKTLLTLDIKSGEWTKKADMGSARAHHGIAILNDQIYCIGGRDHRGRIIPSVEAYDPNSDTWKQVGTLSEGRMGMATVVYNNTIWIMGGVQADPDDPHRHYVVNTVECFDGFSNNWEPKPPLRVPRAYSSAVVLNEKIWLVGGCSGTVEDKHYLQSISAIDVLDEETATWDVKGHIVNPRHCAPAVALESCLYVVGGMSSWEWSALNRTELYITDFDNFYLPAEYPIALTGIAATGLPPYMQTYRSESFSDMIKVKVGHPVPFLHHLRTEFRHVKDYTDYNY